MFVGVFLSCSSGDDRQSVAMKDLLEAIYPRAPEYVVQLEPIQTTNKAVFQYLTTEEELARYPSRTTRSAPCKFVLIVWWDCKSFVVYCVLLCLKVPEKVR